MCVLDIYFNIIGNSINTVVNVMEIANVKLCLKVETYWLVRWMVILAIGLPAIRLSLGWPRWMKHFSRRSEAAICVVAEWLHTRQADMDVSPCLCTRVHTRHASCSCRPLPLAASYLARASIGNRTGGRRGDARNTSERAHLAEHCAAGGRDGRYRLPDQSCASAMTAASARYRHARASVAEAAAPIASYCFLLHACLSDTLISVGPLMGAPPSPTLL